MEQRQAQAVPALAEGVWWKHSLPPAPEKPTEPPQLFHIDPLHLMGLPRSPCRSLALYHALSFLPLTLLSQRSESISSVGSEKGAIPSLLISDPRPIPLTPLEMMGDACLQLGSTCHQMLGVEQAEWSRAQAMCCGPHWGNAAKLSGFFTPISTSRAQERRV
ncbi:hypothetical protein SRHO_G00149660 [Serrasalmus rhombeus]